MHIYSEYKNIHDFDPSTSIPDLTDKVIIVTGGNAGIGKGTVLGFSRHKPHKLYMTARSQAKYDTANPGAKVSFLELDLADIDSIKRAAKTILASESRLDILINNAGILGELHRKPPPQSSLSPINTLFKTAPLPHLPSKLTHPPPHQAPPPRSPPSTTKSMSEPTTSAPQPSPRSCTPSSTTPPAPAPPPPPPRIINISSGAAYSGLIRSTPKFLLPSTTSTPRTDLDPYQRYAISKAAQILWTREYARRYPEIVSVAVHRGRVGTTILDGYMGNVWQRWSFMGLVQRTIDVIVEVLSEERGAATGLWAATAPAEQGVKGKGLVNGELYKPVGVWEAGDARCRDEKLAGELWEWTEGELRGFGIEVG